MLAVPSSPTASPPSPPRRPRLAAVGLLAALLAACASAPPAPGLEEAEPLPGLDGSGGEAALVGLAPIEVWVAPVVDLSGQFQTPLEPLREALHDALVGRWYTPLAIRWGDARLVEAGVDRGSPDAATVLEADAVLRARVLRWDTSELESDLRVRAEVELELVAPGRPVPIWGWRLVQRVAIPERQVREATFVELQEQAAVGLADAALRLLPRRVVEEPRPVSPEDASAPADAAPSVPAGP